MISSHVLQGLPAFIRIELGEKALQRANRAAGFDVELIEDRNFFIPQRSVVGFVDETARVLGDSKLGLLLVPSRNIAAYGTFGRYVTEADTLGQAITRTIATLQYHSTYDGLSVATAADEVRLSYTFALAGSRGYASSVACAAAGILLSLFRAYLPDHWRPRRIELDIPTPCHTSPFEDVFQCPVVFNAPAVAVVVEGHRLMAAPRRTSRPIVTFEDVARDRRGGAPRSLLDIAVAQIRAQLQAGDVSIEDAARSMDTSVRTLQRELQQAGADFRSLTSAVRIERATELLMGTNVSVTSISEELGYSSPAGFSRAFRKVKGLGPREFRSMDPGHD
ncbi:AraC family transcriptional regulator [Mesorhizobium sp. L-8-3]|uniref:AraC family transcriptional regulator n=1 Tax=Mesorhizobium sp. L-8-3 TaxID=2744522 RepID=UPI001FD3837A|nr:AraC family transcriptional regulator [Mesorhizobium sp. L-8-3]